MRQTELGVDNCAVMVSTQKEVNLGIVMYSVTYREIAAEKALRSHSISPGFVLPYVNKKTGGFMTLQERAGLINQYKDGHKQVTDALRGISKEELDFRPAPGKWSVREIVHHLADSEMTSAIRLRRLLVEHHPYIQGFNQDEFAKKLHYSKRPIEEALKAFETSRSTSAELLEFMHDEDWKRTGEHSDSGPYSPEIWLAIYAVHAHNHADQIRRNRSVYKK